MDTLRVTSQTSYSPEYTTPTQKKDGICVEKKGFSDIHWNMFLFYTKENDFSGLLVTTYYILVFLHIVKWI